MKRGMDGRKEGNIEFLSWKKVWRGGASLLIFMQIYGFEGRREGRELEDGVGG